MGNAITASVIFVLVGSGILGDPFQIQDKLDGGFMEVLVGTISLTRWSIPMTLKKTLDWAKTQTGDSGCTSVQLKKVGENYDDYTLWKDFAKQVGSFGAR